MKQSTYSVEHKETVEEEVTSYALNPDVMIPPSLREGELYHVFISYSSTDRGWTRLLIGQLEAHGLQLCYHERDFTPGRTVLENMADCINQSQKVLLALSSEFVRSRWCLLEANMSLFSDCLARKPVVPVLCDNSPSGISRRGGRSLLRVKPTTASTGRNRTGQNFTTHFVVFGQICFVYTAALRIC